MIFSLRVSIYLITDKVLWCFRCSCNSGDRATWNKPEKVRGLDHLKVEAVFASGVISAAIGDDGSLWLWGRSKRGQLGLGHGVLVAQKPFKHQSLADHQIVKVITLDCAKTIKGQTNEPR